MGKKTISFVATEKLAEWIEQQADERMTTVSSAAQQLLAEKYREEQESDGRAEGRADTSKDGSAGAEDDQPEALKRHSDKWWTPESDVRNYGVREKDGGRRYFKTAERAASYLQETYDE